MRDGHPALTVVVAASESAERASVQPAPAAAAAKAVGRISRLAIRAPVRLAASRPRTAASTSEPASQP